MERLLRVLQIEDSEDDAFLIERELRKGGWKPATKRIETADAMHSALAEHQWDVILSDYSMPRFDGMAALEILKRSGVDSPFIIVSGAIGEEKAVELMKAGAYDYIRKDNLVRLVSAIERALRNVKAYREQMAAQRALVESEERFRLLVENSPLPLVIADREEKIEYLNKKFVTVFGYTADDIPNLTELWIHAYPDGQYRRIAKDKWQTVIENAKNFGTEIEPAEYKVTCKDGSLRTMEVWGAPISDKQLILFRDITDRKRAEEEKERLESKLRQAHKMEAVGTLAGGIAHDFNNILYIMMGYLQMALEDVQGNDGVAGFLQETMKAAERAAELVRQILAFSRQSEQKHIPLKIQSIVKEFLKMLRSTLPATIEISRVVDENCGPVLADPTQIHQILMNLSTNANYAMRKKGGNLEIKLESFELGRSDPPLLPGMKSGPYIRLSVRDTGHGMDRKTAERIFEPYFTTKPQGEGTGLGLSVVHGIVKNMNGHINVHSEVGKGATFHIFFPRVQSEKEDQKRIDQKQVPKGNETILLVDDEDQTVDMLRMTLERLGYAVATRTDSVKALEVFKSKPDRFNLVITDMTMPKMTGLELSKKILGIRPDIPIILCTGFSDNLSAESKSVGIRTLAMKPIVKRQLAEMIRRILDK